MKAKGYSMQHDPYILNPISPLARAALRGRTAPGAAPHSLPGSDDINRTQLPNGVTVLSRPNFNSPSVVISGHLPAGGLFDPDDRLGLADFTASALMRGTARHTFQQISDLLESAGASLNVAGGTHTASFVGKALSEDLDLLLGMLAEALRQPVFPSDQVERLRAQLLTGLAIRAQDTGEMASLAFDQVVYAGHPYSRPDDGYPETIQAITQADLAEFHRKHYGPRGLVIAIVGGIQPVQAVEKAAQALGDWQNPLQPEPPTLPALSSLEHTVTRKVGIPGKFQSDIVLGAAGPARRSQDYTAASLGNSVLGQFGMMGRIGDVVREQAGLAYYAHSSLSGGIGPGPWSVSAGVDPANVTQAVDMICQEIARFVREPVSAEELADSQANFIGRLPLSLESNSGVAGALINVERYDLGLDYYRNYPDMVRAVTPEMVLEAARRYLDPDRLGIAVAGPD
jgi:zinc protease